MHRLFRLSIATYTVNSTPTQLTNKQAAQLLKDIYKANKSDHLSNNERHITIQNAFNLYNQINEPKDHISTNTLISLCLHFNSSEHVLRIWNDIEHINHMSYILLLKCCAQSHIFTINHFIQTLERIKLTNYKLTDNDHKSYSFCVSKLIANKCKTYKELKNVHSLINDDSIFIKTALITAYAQFGNISDAQSVFMSIADSDKDAVSVGAMMKALMNNRYYKEVITIYNTFTALHNNVLHLMALQTCIQRNDYQFGKTICDGILSKHGSFEMDIKLKTTLIDFYGEFSCIEQAKKLFYSIDNRQRNIVCINAMMKCLVNNDCSNEALQFYDTYCNQCEFNDITYLFAIKACINDNNIEKGKSIHSSISTRQYSIHLNTTLMAFYGHFSDIQTCMDIFDSIQNEQKTIVAITEMMNAFCKCGMYKECIELFENIKNINDALVLDVMCYANMFKACTESTSYHLGMEIHNALMEKGNELILNHSIIQSSLINFYGKCGKLDICHSLFDGNEHKDTAICNAMINCLGKNGDGSESVQLYYEYFRECIIADRNTFIYLISACNHSGLIEEAMRIWRNEIKDKSIKYDSYLITTLIDCVSRNGDLESAYGLVTEYEMNKVCSHHINDKFMYISLLSKCKKNKSDDLARTIYDDIKTKKLL